MDKIKQNTMFISIRLDYLKKYFMFRLQSKTKTKIRVFIFMYYKKIFIKFFLCSTFEFEFSIIREILNLLRI
jgi:hypothetical protein